MAWALRLGGWTLFGAGAVVFVLKGSFRNLSDPVAMSGLISMATGMLLTALSSVLASWAEARGRKP